MKKNLLIALFATASMAGVAQAYNVVGSWDENSTSTTITPSGSIAGNWTMDIKLNNERLTTMFRNQASDTSKSGNSLFTVEGSASRSIGGTRANEDGLATTFVMGWGSGWYVTQDTGVFSGVQIGVTDKTGNPKNLGEDKVISGTLDPDPHSAFDVYRFNTQANGSKHTLNSWIGWDPIPDWDIYEVSNETVTDSRLTVTHSVNADGSSQTSISLTLNYKYDRTLLLWSDTVEGTVTFTASIDDSTNYNVPVGSGLGGSAFYDVDDLTQISGINKDFVTSMDVYDEALVVGADGNLVPQNPDTPGGDTPAAAVPEPTTATLSLLALAGLCARRRRK